jgi:ABC-type transporter Mla subunit MlaD
LDPSRQAAAICVLEAATDDLMYALRRTEPDLEGAAVALKERETALRQIVRSSAASRPADLNARLRRVLERDQEASDQLRREMEAIRERMATTRQMVDSFGEAVAVAEDAP